MQRKFLIAYFMIFICLLMVMGLSRHTSDKVRGKSVAWMSPLWETILNLKYWAGHPLQPSPFSHLTVEEELSQAKLENQLLEIELKNLNQEINDRLVLSSQMAQNLSILPEREKGRSLEILKQRMNAIPARVIFRTFDTWNSSLWINVGASTNRALNETQIAINSPVIIGKAIVGIIDYVGENQSRVRLISDSRLTLSVRAARGGEQESVLHEQVERLLQQIKAQKSVLSSIEEQKELVPLLRKFQNKLQNAKKTSLLAKGELHGSTNSSRFGQEVLLRGIGFNYDFADEEGGARDLRSGKSLQQSQEKAIPILKTNDILVTTGIDGIFPPGFQVAIVTEVKLLKEGDYFYELEARPIADPVEELTLVFVLPPVASENNFLNTF